MKAYLFGNRRRLRCLYGAPSSPYQYIPLSYYGDFGRLTTPEWRLLPLPQSSLFDARKQQDAFISHESRGAMVRGVSTHAGMADLASGVIDVGYARSFANSNFLVYTNSFVLEIAEGRHRPTAIADFNLFHGVPGTYEGFPLEQIDPHCTATSLKHAGGIICFLEKTASGYGQRYIRIALRQLSMADDAPSHAASLCSLFTVSAVDGDSEEVLHAALVPLFCTPEWRGSQVIPGRVSLAYNNDGDQLLYVSILCVTESGSGPVRLGMSAIGSWPAIAHTAVVPYSPPSIDATVFGAVTTGDTRSSIIAAYESPVAWSGLRVVETPHDALADVPFMAGATGRPDIDSPGAPAGFLYRGGVSTRADEIVFSEPRDRVVTGSVRCGADLYYPAPETEVESTQLSPVIELGPVRPPFLYEMYAGSRQVVQAKTLAVTAHATDRSGLAHHSSVAHALPSDGSVHLLGKKFSSATVTVTLRGEGQIPEPYVYSFSQAEYAKTIPENQDISIEQFYELTKGHHPTRSPLYSLPLGTFECTPFGVGGAGAMPGMMRASLQQIDKQYSYVPPIDSLDVTNGLGWTIDVKSQAELVALFGVAMQEYGEFASSDYINRQPTPYYANEYPISTFSSPANRRGQINDVSFFVPPAFPSPILVMQLFARTTTTITKSDSYNFTFQQPIPGSTVTSSSPSNPPPELGKFVFSKEQTAALMNGEEVRATTWLLSSPHQEGDDIGDEGAPWPQAYFLFNDIFNTWPGLVNVGRFWMNFKVRLNIDS